jgi:biotin carboxylase
MGKHVLVVGPWDEVVAKAYRMEPHVRFTFFQKAGNLTGFQKKHRDRFCLVDYEDIDESLAVAARVHERIPIDAVVSFTEYGLLSASRIGERLGVAANPVRPVLLTRYKQDLRGLLNAHSHGFVRYKICAGQDDVGAFFAEHGECIVKPLDGAGSDNVTHVRSAEDVRELPAISDDRRFIAEEFVEGPEYSVEALSLSGRHRILAITSKTTTGSPNFVETGHVMPTAGLDEETERRIHLFVARFLDLIGHEEGPSHTEIKVGDGGDIKVIESHTRAGGDRIWEMVELACGVDAISETIAHLASYRLPNTTAKNPVAAIKFLTAPAGTIRRVSGVESIRALPEVERVAVTAKIGDIAKALKHSDDRLGYVLVTAPTHQRAAAVLRQVEEHLVVETTVPEVSTSSSRWAI